MSGLTDEERLALGVWDTGLYACASAEDCTGYADNKPGHHHEGLTDVVARIADEREARTREAIATALEAGRCCPAPTWTWCARCAAKHEDATIARAGGKS